MARVLVVDDERSIREILSDLLATDGHLVDTAADGSEALEVIHGWRPDVVLLDMLMPEVGAWDFLARYNRDSMCRGLPVAILSTTATAGGALEEAGVEFIDENGGGPGVRLRKGRGLRSSTRRAQPSKMKARRK